MLGHRRLRVASGAGVAGQRGRVALRAGPTGAAMVHGERMRPVERRGLPGPGRVADPQPPRRTVPCEAGLAWQAAHVLGVPLNLPPAWQLWQDTLRWAPVNGNDDRAWSKVQSVPRRGLVAGGAVLAEGSLVAVVAGVASDARRRRPDVPAVRMAGRTGGLGVPARQGEPRLGVVEGDVLPAGGRVAGGAVARELSAVRVVRVVAAAAGEADPRPVPVDVAGLAERTDVPPDEWEARPVVVDGGVRPGRGGVALLARGAQAALVDVVGGMAGDALGLGGLERLDGRRTLVAGAAQRLVVPAGQGVRGMVERGPVGVDPVVTVRGRPCRRSRRAAPCRAGRAPRGRRRQAGGVNDVGEPGWQSRHPTLPPSARSGCARRE